MRGLSKDVVQSELDGLQAMVAREFRVEPSVKDLWATRGNIKALGKIKIKLVFDPNITLFVKHNVSIGTILLNLLILLCNIDQRNNN